MLATQRIFKDNNLYDNHITYGDALVSAVEWFYTNEAPQNSNLCYQFNGVITMPDLMTIVRLIIGKAQGKHALLDLKEVVNELETNENGKMVYVIGDKHRIDYKDQDFIEYVCFINMPDEVIEAAFWIAYIYFCFFSEGETGKKYKRVRDVIFSVLPDIMGITLECYESESLLMKMKERTVKAFVEYMSENIDEYEKTTDKQANKQDSEKKELLRKIEELEAENKRQQKLLDDYAQVVKEVKETIKTANGQMQELKGNYQQAIDEISRLKEQNEALYEDNVESVRLLKENNVKLDDDNKKAFECVCIAKATLNPKKGQHKSINRFLAMMTNLSPATFDQYWADTSDSKERVKSLKSRIKLMDKYKAGEKLEKNFSVTKHKKFD